MAKDEFFLQATPYHYSGSLSPKTPITIGPLSFSPGGWIGTYAQVELEYVLRSDFSLRELVDRSKLSVNVEYFFLGSHVYGCVHNHTLRHSMA